ncbi:MAG: class I tRNA ligase family protein [Candidatus Moraniibacteriota bacterium]
MEFNPASFEKKWQETWKDSSIYHSDNSTSKSPCFVVDMFPYPSGSSMHVGHPRGYVATDVYARFKRMSGFNVLHPMGWDAFGLPAEETAIENKEYPSATVERNIKKFKSQLIMLGLGYDWSREINTTDPKYYVHTQRIFLEFFRRGLAMNNTVAVNWCPNLGTVLANEDIVDGKSERGGHPVFQRPMRQWILAITKYADRLIDDLDLLPHWPDKVKNAQRNWIGRSEGYEFSFLTNVNIDIPVFTTRIETLPGATFLVIAPESELVKEITVLSTNAQQINEYVLLSSQKTNLERQSMNDKTGIIVGGVTATNPFTRTEMPVVIADYVLASYGTGAIMAVPAQDERDSDMEKSLGLEKNSIIANDVMVSAESLNGKTINETRKIISKMVGANIRKCYKIRDWVFSRQRFWGEPFPIVWIQGRSNYEQLSKGPIGEWLPSEPVVYTADDAVEHFAVPVIPEFLDAMRLPLVDSYQPTGALEGPLAGIDEWVNTFIDPKTGMISNHPDKLGWIPACRETNTMPQWAGSSWYWLRYMDPENKDVPFSKELAQYWGPVNVYAGADHAVAHLIYARFWHKVMQDAGMVNFPEPFERLEFLGYILAEDGSKISKRKGNSRSPEDVIKEVGADTFRLYEMFIGPFEKPIPWNDEGLIGARRFLERVWKLSQLVIKKNALHSDLRSVAAIHKSIQKVGDDIEGFKFNTAISSLMMCLNEIQETELTISDFSLFISLLAPFAPHIAEEIWLMAGNEKSIHISAWPEVRQDLIRRNSVILPIQINGKIRLRMTIPMNMDGDGLRKIVLSNKDVQKYLLNKEPKKFISVPNRIVSILV